MKSAIKVQNHLEDKNACKVLKINCCKIPELPVKWAICNLVFGEIEWTGEKSCGFCSFSPKGTNKGTKKQRQFLKRNDSFRNCYSPTYSLDGTNKSARFCEQNKRHQIAKCNWNEQKVRKFTPRCLKKLMNTLMNEICFCFWFEFYSAVWFLVFQYPLTLITGVWE